MKNYKNVTEYIADFPKDVQVILKKIRAIVKKAAPKGEEAIRYGMPTLQLGGKNVLHFAAYKKHIGFYPTPSGINAFKKEISKYKWSKGTVQFPLAEPIPFTLIEKIVKFRVKESLLGKK